MSERQWPEEWISAVDDALDDWFSAKALDVWPDFQPAAVIVLDALADMGVLQPPDGPVTP
jgi:hypothetical protein